MRRRLPPPAEQPIPRAAGDFRSALLRSSALNFSTVSPRAVRPLISIPLLPPAERLNARTRILVRDSGSRLTAPPASTKKPDTGQADTTARKARKAFFFTAVSSSGRGCESGREQCTRVTR